MNLDKISFKLPTVKFEKKINEKKSLTSGYFNSLNVMYWVLLLHLKVNVAHF